MPAKKPRRYSFCSPVNSAELITVLWFMPKFPLEATVRLRGTVCLCELHVSGTGQGDASQNESQQMVPWWNLRITIRALLGAWNELGLRVVSAHRGDDDLPRAVGTDSPMSRA